MSQGPDSGLVNARDKEGCGAARAEAVGFNAFRGNVGDVIDRCSGATKGGGDVASGNVVGSTGGVKVAVEGGVQGGVELVQVFDAATYSLDGAEDGIPRGAMAQGFPASAVLLVSVGKGHIGPLLHIMQRAVAGGDALDESTTEGGISQMEGLASAALGGWREGVLARAAEEEEGKCGEIADGLSTGLIVVLQ